jgi:hypothetical protein
MTGGSAAVRHGPMVSGKLRFLLAGGLGIGFLESLKLDS